MPFADGAMLDGTLPVARLAAVLYERPARLFGLWPRKRSLEPGADADIVLFDPNRSTAFDSRRLVSQAGRTGRLWDGVLHIGHVVTTFLRGEPVYTDRKSVGRAGYGEILTRGGGGAT